VELRKQGDRKHCSDECVQCDDVRSPLVDSIVTDKFMTPRRYEAKLMGSTSHGNNRFGKCAGGHVFGEERHQSGVRT